jgi:phage terminase small subunit
VKPPKGLGKPGVELWRRIAADVADGFELDERERQALAHACRLEDELAGLEAAVAAEGATVTGSKGQPRVHPALSEARQHRLAQARLLASLQLDRPEELAPGVRQAQRAAQARWQQRRRAAALRKAS